MDPVDTLTEVSCALLQGDSIGAAAQLEREYPFTAIPRVTRAYTALRSTQVFLRDGFVDRYSGQRLVFPGALRILSLLLPDAFPFHPNWKVGAVHRAYWELFATVDHIVPIARGGQDEASNWVTTSMLRNSAKAHWTLAELGWRLHPPGDRTVWNGLMSWFAIMSAKQPSLLADPYVRRWHRVAVTVGAG
jgi:5-methylcytosine-specific restriction endonuclease McrA